MAFTPEAITLVEEIPQYSHGYLEEKVQEIKEKRDRIMERNLSLEPTTLEEFKEIILPWCRINRTEEFILDAKKKKEKNTEKPTKEKVIKEKPIKVKKLTKKEINAETMRIYMKQFSKDELTEEEKQFYSTYMKDSLI